VSAPEKTRRVWSAVHGEGTMFGTTSDCRVEFDSGFVLPLDWRKWEMGTPRSRELEVAAFKARSKKGKELAKKLFDLGSEHSRWDTYTLRSGDTVILRRGGKAPEGTPPPGEDAQPEGPKQLGMRL
jgi:hypothetical protein